MEIDTDLQRERTIIYKIIEKTLINLEANLEELKYGGSFLEKNQGRFMNFDTFSYNLSEHKYSELLRDDYFEVGNPNIDTSVNMNSNT